MRTVADGPYSKTTRRCTVHQAWIARDGVQPIASREKTSGPSGPASAAQSGQTMKLGDLVGRPLGELDRAGGCLACHASALSLSSVL